MEGLLTEQFLVQFCFWAIAFDQLMRSLFEFKSYFQSLPSSVFVSNSSFIVKPCLQPGYSPPFQNVNYSNVIPSLYAIRRVITISHKCMLHTLIKHYFSSLIYFFEAYPAVSHAVNNILYYQLGYKQQNRSSSPCPLLCGILIYTFEHAVTSVTHTHNQKEQMSVFHGNKLF